MKTDMSNSELGKNRKIKLVEDKTQTMAMKLQ